MPTNTQTMVSSPLPEVEVAPEAEPMTDDDLSSILSELDDGSDPANAQLLALDGAENEDDTEAETERLENSPNKSQGRRMSLISPSKLGQQVAGQLSPGVEKFSDSAMSSPMSSDDDVLSEDGETLESGPGKSMGLLNYDALLQSSQKRKRSMLDDEMDAAPDEGDEDPLSRRKRIRSVEPNDDDLSDASDLEERNLQDTREGSADAPDKAPQEAEEQDALGRDEQEEVPMSAKKKPITSRSLRGRALGDDAEADAPNTISDQEDGAASDDDDVAGAEGEDAADEAEVAAKSEEELQKRLAAMEELTAIEQRFATLRDRLYDERIAEINQELSQLTNPKPTHPELLRQIEAVRKYRDDKFDLEQKLLVHKVGALKRKSIAERATIHSAFFQTIRDLREDYLERASEHFYRIQRDRFKTETRIPEFSITFPERRSVQISQQTAYNKEVSLLSGVAKYVGFPAAPDLSNARNKEIEDDLEKMGISPTPTKVAKQTRHSALLTYGSSSRPEAEEQFLEQNPWANPQHPAHKFNLSRQLSNPSPANEHITPAQPSSNNVPIGSASTILDPAAHLSSMANTPHDDQPDARNGNAAKTYPYHHPSSSPVESRRLGATDNEQQPPTSSPLATRAIMTGHTTPPRLTDAHTAERSSPSMIDPFGPRDGGILTTSGLTRFKV